MQLGVSTVSKPVDLAERARKLEEFSKFVRKRVRATIEEESERYIQGTAAIVGFFVDFVPTCEENFKLGAQRVCLSFSEVEYIARPKRDIRGPKLQDVHVDNISTIELA